MVTSAAVAAVALALAGPGAVLAVTALAADPPPPVPVRGAGTLPDAVSSVPGSAVSVQDAPAGRAGVLAQVVGGLSATDEDDLAVIGADADSYRRVPLQGSALDVEGTSFADIAIAVLSPDGTRVAMAGMEDEAVVLVVRDLRSGRSRVYDSAALSAPYALAWSPDGRALAVLDGGPDGYDRGRVQLLDLAAGSFAVVKEGVGRGGVAFSADGRRLLAQDAALLLVVERDGTEVRRVPYVGSGVLAQRHAWSPDGALAAIEGCEEDCEAVYGPGSRTVSFVPLAGGDAPDPIELRGGRLASVVGWRTPHEVVLGVSEDDGERTVIAAFDVRSGTSTVLSTLDVYDVIGVDLAADVLARGMVRRAGRLDGGPRPAWPGLLLVAAGSVLGLVGAGVVGLVAAVTRHRAVAPGAAGPFAPPPPPSPTLPLPPPPPP